MFQSKTVIVVGAGASSEVGLPVGTELAKRIGELLDVRFDDFGSRCIAGDGSLFQQLSRDRDVRALQQAAWLIRDGVGLANSIDDFLDRHQSNSLALLYGKAAIVRAVLEAERRSKVYLNRATSRDSITWNGVSDTWFVKLIRMLGVGVKKDNVQNIFQNVSFVVFNYDRCLEHFLIEALQPAYALDNVSARRLVEGADIWHPYGSVGDLTNESGPQPVSYGAGEYGIPTSNLIDRIRTYAEGCGDEIRHAVQTAVSEAETIIFLGFAFHDQNLKLLQGGSGRKARRVFATAYGMSTEDQEVVGKRLGEFLDPKIGSRGSVVIRGAKCGEFFDVYSKSLPSQVVEDVKKLRLKRPQLRVA